MSGGLIMRFFFYNFIQVTLLLNILALLSMSPAFAHGGENEAFSKEEVNAPGEVSVDAQGIQAIKIKTAEVAVGKLNSTLKATGEVQADETRSFNVTAPVAGVVKQVLVKQGDTVKPGQIMAVIHSIEVATTLTQLLNDRTKTNSDIARVKTQYQSDIKVQSKTVELAKIAYEREETLLSEGISARKLYLEAKSNYETNLVKLETLKERLEQEIALLKRQFNVNIETVKGQLKIMGIPGISVDEALRTGVVSANLPIKAPVAGWVVKRDITLGERVEPLKSIFSIVDLSPIWVMVDVYQEQIPIVKEGQKVYIETPSKEKEVGSISSKGAVVDPVTKTLHVRIIADNPFESLRPGMFVEAEIDLGKNNQTGILVPESAIVSFNNRNFVYEHHIEEGHYEPVEVTLGTNANGMIQVLSGIKEKELIVVSGAKQLLAQSVMKPGSDHKHEDEKHEEHDEHSKTEEGSKNNVGIIMGLAIGLGIAFVIAVVWFLLSRFGIKKRND